MRQRGFGIFEIVIGLVVIAALTAIGLALNNLAFHHYVDPEKEKWDKSEAIYKQNEQVCIDTNKRQAAQFNALRIEVDGIAKTFADAAAQQEANYKTDLAREVAKAKASSPKIDALRKDAATPAPAGATELDKCRKAQAALNEYAVDVQKIRELLGLPQVEVVGPTRVGPPK